MIPYNCTAEFEIRSTILDSTGVSVGDDVVKVKVRACISRPRSWTNDPEISDLDRTREWANLRIERIPDEFESNSDIKVMITPDGIDKGEYWEVDRVKQPVSVGGIVVSNKLTLSRAVRGVMT